MKVREAPETKALGIVGLTGQVFGETTPSVTDVPVIGQLTQDYAVNVHFEKRGESFWFAVELLEFVDYAVGTEIRLDGVPKTWVRGVNGEWIEHGESRTTAPPSDGIA